MIGTYTLGGLVREWAESEREEMREASRDLARLLVPLEDRIVRNFREARRREFDRHIFGCGVREESQIRQAVRREVERTW